MQRCKIIDGHTHIASAQFIPDEFFVGIARNLLAEMTANNQPVKLDQLVAIIKAQHSDHYADALVSEMDAAGVSAAIILLPDFTYRWQSHFNIREMADLYLKISERHPNRFFIFLGVDPRHGNEGLDFFRKNVEGRSIRGFKIYPPCGYSPSDERLYPYYEICEKHRLPVLMHTGPTTPTLSFEFSDPSLADRAALEFPNIDFILAHGGVHNVAAAVALCKFRPNVYLDIGGFVSTMHPRGWKAQLSELFSFGINHKIIYGTDWPVFRAAGSMQKLLNELFDEEGPLNGLPAKDIENIMGATILRLMSLN